MWASIVGACWTRLWGEGARIAAVSVGLVSVAGLAARITGVGVAGVLLASVKHVE